MVRKAALYYQETIFIKKCKTSCNSDLFQVHNLRVQVQVLLVQVRVQVLSSRVQVQVTMAQV